MGQRRRVKISATVDPELLDGVDAYIREHPGRDRSKVIDEALMLWLAQEQDRAMEAQFDDPDVPEDELRQWNAILDANARMMWHRGRE
jgi:Arc/MetJ-type ribon-helix-helix transcriptional regulator